MLETTRVVVVATTPAIDEPSDPAAISADDERPAVRSSDSATDSFDDTTTERAMPGEFGPDPEAGDPGSSGDSPVSSPEELPAADLDVMPPRDAPPGELEGAAGAWGALAVPGDGDAAAAAPAPALSEGAPGAITGRHGPALWVAGLAGAGAALAVIGIVGLVILLTLDDADDGEGAQPPGAVTTDVAGQNDSDDGVSRQLTLGGRLPRRQPVPRTVSHHPERDRSVAAKGRDRKDEHLRHRRDLSRGPRVTGAAKRSADAGSPRRLFCRWYPRWHAGDH